MNNNSNDNNKLDKHTLQQLNRSIQQFTTQWNTYNNSIIQSVSKLINSIIKLQYTLYNDDWGRLACNNNSMINSTIQHITRQSIIKKSYLYINNLQSMYQQLHDLIDNNQLLDNKNNTNNHMLQQYITLLQTAYNNELQLKHDIITDLIQHINNIELYIKLNDNNISQKQQYKSIHHNTLELYSMCINIEPYVNDNNSEYKILEQQLQVQM